MQITNISTSPDLYNQYNRSARHILFFIISTTMYLRLAVLPLTASVFAALALDMWRSRQACIHPDLHFCCFGILGYSTVIVKYSVGFGYGAAQSLS